MTYRALTLILFFSSIVQAKSIEPTSLLSLAKEKQWQKLIHYHQSSLFSNGSEVDDANFFISPKGKQSAADELTATVDQLQHDPSAKCRYPARFTWLAQQLNWNTSVDDLLDDCPELAQWYQTINPEKASIIFPASYINSPSSMFGHLFIRIDSGQQNNDLLAHSINFGANVSDQDGSLLYAMKGLFGGYPGVVSLIPYYEKVKEYNDIEHRDIWEYELNFSQQEIQRLVFHVWELKDIYFDYYFIDENCAYRILALLEVARPELDLLSSFYDRAIPADVIKVVNRAEVVNHISYRPSLATDLANKLQQLTHEEQQWVLALVENPDLSDAAEFRTIAPGRRAAIFEIAAQWIRYQLSDLPNTRDYAKKGYAFLLKRSKLDADANFTPVKTPSVRDDQGHNTLRLSGGLGQLDDQSVASFSIRSAYHDLTDPAAGYLNGAHIEFFDVNVTVSENNHWKLQNFTLLSLMSLSTRDAFFKPLSWNFDVRTERLPTANNSNELFTSIQGGAGVTYGSTDNRVYLLAGAQLLNNERSISDTFFQASLRTGWLFNQPGYQTHLELQAHKDTGRQAFDTARLSLNHTFNLDKHRAFSIQWARHKLDQRYNSSLFINYRHYL